MVAKSARGLRNIPEFVVHFTPVHCSCMKQIEQWFSILQRKRLCMAGLASTEELHTKLLQFIKEYTEHVYPFTG